MNENSKNIKKKNNLDETLNEFDSFFNEEPDVNQKAWGLTLDFFHMVIANMEKMNLSRADLARKLGVSRSRITQILNTSPNLSIKKMVEIADAVGLDLVLTSPQIPLDADIFAETIIVVKQQENVLTAWSDIINVGIERAGSLEIGATSSFKIKKDIASKPEYISENFDEEYEEYTV